MNNQINWQEFRCRCSAISKLLTNGKEGQQITEKQLEELKKLEDKETRTVKQEEEMSRLQALKANSGKVVLGITCIEYMMEVYAWETQGMVSVSKESLDAMQVKKGKQGELEAGVLMSLVDGVFYKRHKDRIYNDYLSGEIDFYVGESVYEATNITDIKNAFDYPGFLKKLNNGLENGQRDQMAGYGDITGAKNLYIANCLISFTPDMITDMEYKILRKVNAATIESPEFLELWPKIKKSMIFDKIPPAQRVSKIKVEPFTEFERQKVYDRVKYCRDWLCKFHEEREKLQ